MFSKDEEYERIAQLEAEVSKYKKIAEQYRQQLLKQTKDGIIVENVMTSTEKAEVLKGVAEESEKNEDFTIIDMFTMLQVLSAGTFYAGLSPSVANEMFRYINIINKKIKSKLDSLIAKEKGD